VLIDSQGDARLCGPSIGVHRYDRLGSSDRVLLAPLGHFHDRPFVSSYNLIIKLWRRPTGDRREPIRPLQEGGAR